MEVYRKPAIGRVHLELSPGSTCFRLSPEIGFDQLHDDDTHGGRTPSACVHALQSTCPTLQSKENDRDEI
jgi:hypothetical protein